MQTEIREKPKYYKIVFWGKVKRSNGLNSFCDQIFEAFSEDGAIGQLSNIYETDWIDNISFVTEVDFLMQEDKYRNLSRWNQTLQKIKTTNNKQI